MKHNHAYFRVGGISKFSAYLAFFSLIILSLLLTACGASQSISEGITAPDFSLPAADGSTVTLADYAGEQPVLLFFHMADG